MSGKRPDFGNYSAKKVQADKTQLFTFHDLEGTPTLQVKPATKHNRAYSGAAKRATPKLKRIQREGGTSSEDRAIELLAELFSQHVVVDWPTPPVDSAGKPVPFSPENCQGFLQAIPDYMFDDPSGSYPSLVRFASNPLNFSDGYDEDEEKELAGNSQTD